MKQVVYVDVLLFVNLFVNYFLLRAAGVLAREPVRRVRILLGSALGSLCSLIIFLPPLHNLFVLLLKAVFAVVIVLAAFRIHTLHAFGRLLAAFLAETFLFGGLNYALYALAAPRGMLYGNGAVYYSVSVPLLIVITVACYGVSMLISRLLKRNVPENTVYTLSITLDDKTVTCPALLDTGNGLRDSFSDTPVIIARYETVRELLPVEVQPFFADGTTALPSGEFAKRFRYIPYHSVGGGGVLPAFRPDFIEIRGIQKRLRHSDVYIAASRERFAGGQYGALLHPRLVDIQEKSGGVNSEKHPKADQLVAGNSFQRIMQRRRGNLLHKRSADSAAAPEQGGGSGSYGTAGRGGRDGA